MEQEEFIDGLAEGETLITEEQVNDSNGEYGWVGKGDYRIFPFTDGANIAVSNEFLEENGLLEYDYIRAEKHKNKNGMKYEGDTILFYGEYFKVEEEE